MAKLPGFLPLLALFNVKYVILKIRRFPLTALNDYAILDLQFVSQFQKENSYGKFQVNVRNHVQPT